MSKAIDEAEQSTAATPGYSSHVDAYWNATFQEELASWEPLATEAEASSSDEEYATQELDDLRHALILLSGYHDRSRLRPEKKYLAPSEEYAGRKAIARLLRSDKPIDRTILVRLAALFDPDRETEPFIELSSIDRRLEFVPRDANRPTTTEIGRIELAIAFKASWLAKGRARGAREEALEETAEKYALSRRSVEAAWTYYKSVVGRPKVTARG